LSNLLSADISDLLNDPDPQGQFASLSRSLPGKVAFSTSFGKEDQVITDMIWRSGAAIRIFTLDTGRLFSETYDLADKTRSRYKITIEAFHPDTPALEHLVREKGFNSFYESVDNRRECCRIRKVQPLGRALQGADVWITGLRREQSAGRSLAKLFEWTEDYQVYKFNPLVNWTVSDVDRYIQQHDVPCNPLHHRGFLSIGCAPCTRAVLPGEEERAGRWWWENSQKECGLHTERTVTA
jgi:phosphoadenosine phosphosulfate reductase